MNALLQLAVLLKSLQKWLRQHTGDTIITNNYQPNGRSQWPRGLRDGTATARFLGLWVRIPPGVWMSVSCECSVYCHVGVCVTGRSLAPSNAVCLSMSSGKKCQPNVEGTNSQQQVTK
jgi:hypothetical protein